MGKVMTTLADTGPILSGELAEILESKYSISNVAARQAISRASDPVMKLRNISFQNNQRFIYLGQHFGTRLYYNNLLECLKEQSKAYHYILHALSRNYGFLHAEDISTFSSSPIKPLKGHRLATSIVGDLEQTGLIQKNDKGLYSWHSVLGFPESYNKFKALDIAKRIVMHDFHALVRNTNLISYDSAKLLDQEPEFYKFQWSFTAPSYVLGLRSRNKPTFVVADIILGRELTVEDIAYFLAKTSIITQSRSHSPFIPILLLERATSEAFIKLKQSGVVVGFIGTLFGQNYAQLLKEIAYTIERASAILSKDPNQYFELVSKIGKLEGQIGNIKGALFELTVAYYYRTQFSSTYMEVNKIIREKDSGKCNEVDVFLQYHKELRFIECKGHNSPLDDNYVKRWLQETVPNLRRWALGQDVYADKELKFELWCTGGFKNDAKSRLEQAVEDTKRYAINFFGPKEIMQIMDKANDSQLKEIIRIHFQK